MKKENTVKKHAGQGIKQVELLNYLLNNLQQFNLKPTSKLVLLYLAGCYNPKHTDVFPKQKTIALQMGISERSVISAIQELHKEGLVISERKYTNRYRFTARILNLGGMVEDFLQPEEITEAECKKCTLQSENFSPLYNRTIIEQKKEQANSIEFEGFKILKDYAIKKGAKNVQAYVNAIIKSGNAEEIIQEYKKIERKASFMENETKRVIADAKFAKENAVTELPQSFYNLREILVKNGAKKRG